MPCDLCGMGSQGLVRFERTSGTAVEVCDACCRRLRFRFLGRRFSRNAPPDRVWRFADRYFLVETPAPSGRRIDNGRSKDT